MVTEIKILNIKGEKPLMGKDLKDFQGFLEQYADKIVEKWIGYFVYHKDVDFERISKRLKWKFQLNTIMLKFRILK